MRLTPSANPRQLLANMDLSFLRGFLLPSHQHGAGPQDQLPQKRTTLRGLQAGARGNNSLVDHTAFLRIALSLVALKGDPAPRLWANREGSLQRRGGTGGKKRSALAKTGKNSSCHVFNFGKQRTHVLLAACFARRAPNFVCKRPILNETEFRNHPWAVLRFQL